MKKFLGTMTAVAVALSASAAMAATYISGPLPSEFGAGFVSSSSDILKNVQKASKEGAKLAGAIEKCYSKGIKNFSGNKATNVNACLFDTKKGARTKYAAKVVGINAKAPGLPDCHNYVNDGALIQLLVKNFTPLTYCASPSGAFVDGASGF